MISVPVVSFQCLLSNPLFSSDKRISLVNYRRRQHAQLAHFAVSHEQALNSVHMTVPAKVSGLVHAQSPKSRSSHISKFEVCLDIPERIVGELVLLHDLFPGLLVLGIGGPCLERPVEAGREWRTIA